MSGTLTLSRRRVLRALHLGEFPLHIFDSHCELNGRRYVFDRECSGPTGVDTVIRLDGRALDFGEDPRAFVHDDRVCAVSAISVEGYGYRNHLYICHDDGTFERLLMLVPGNLPPGKNWSPFRFADGKPGFIHSLDPLIVLREKRRERGIILMEARHGLGTRSEMGPGQFSVYRGGSRGVTIGRQVFGFGHTTRYLPGETETFSDTLGFDHLCHRPFGWLLDPEAPIIRFFDVAGEFDPRFSVVDPTSLVHLPDGGLELITTEVERHFHDAAGEGAVCSYRVEVPAWLADAAQQDEPGIAVPARHFSSSFGATEGGVLRAGLGDVDGHVIYGPYVPLTAGDYRVDFLFGIEAASGTAEARLEFDVAADMTAYPTAEQLALGAMAAAMDDDGHIATVRFSHIDARRKLEFRVHARGFSAGEILFRGAIVRRDG